MPINWPPSRKAQEEAMKLNNRVPILARMNPLAQFITGWIMLVDALVLIASLGLYHPGLNVRFIRWRMTKRINSTAI